MARIVTESVGSTGPWLVVRDGVLRPDDGTVIERLLKTAAWKDRSVVTLDARRLDGFAPGAEKALRYAARVVHAKHAGFTVLYDPSGPPAQALKLSGVMADWEIDFAPCSPDQP